MGDAHSTVGATTVNAPLDPGIPDHNKVKEYLAKIDSPPSECPYKHNQESKNESKGGCPMQRDDDVNPYNMFEKQSGNPILRDMPSRSACIAFEISFSSGLCFFM
ncbi:hypothetical protein AVEN_117491-1 [Araneus ventricosus]|uniref:Uncharacterized protein n=1 Tax=Araneus ventricosus TaxID=182803 RepID=A0A4Y2JUD8_ARAVE|nr:hypothetical protein AVEN_117491-1 [Araneus ventricosus]